MIQGNANSVSNFGKDDKHSDKRDSCLKMDGENRQ